ncbi:hypothetical protein ACFHW2_12180 [Actinomadura sp. LOL_016]|uniref:hypothetical protein n=1 Tax=unclassified Actinomadura TaxID=2626254 RepID=UPI003A8098A0
MTAVYGLIILAVVALLALGGRSRRETALYHQAHTAQDQRDAAEAEVARLKRLTDQALARATHSQDQRDAATADVVRLMTGLRSLADELDQGAHQLAARRLRRFVDEQFIHPRTTDTNGTEDPR